MRLRHIEVFNAIMLTGSVSAAARLIKVTQPAVSHTLQHAEIQLGFSLFQRTGGRLVPTPEALKLYPRIGQVFAQLEELQRLARNLRDGLDAGELRVLSVLALSYDVLPKALLLFRQKHPDIPVTVSSLHSAQIVSAMVLQEADVGFAFGSATHPALVQSVVAQSPVVCAVPLARMQGRLVSGGALKLAALADQPVISLDARDPLGMCLAQVCREQQVRWGAQVTVQTYHAALAMAHHGVGIALVDRVTAAAADLTRVAIVPLDPAIALPVQVLHASAQPLSVPARSLIRCVNKILQKTLA